MQYLPNFFFREIMAKTRGWKKPLCKYTIFISSWSLIGKDETFSHSLGSKRRIFKSIVIFLEYESCNISGFLIRNLPIVLAKE